MIFGRKDTIIRKGYNYASAITVVEQKRNDGTIYAYAFQTSGPYIAGKGRTFEELCSEYHIQEIRR